MHSKSTFLIIFTFCIFSFNILKGQVENPNQSSPIMEVDRAIKILGTTSRPASKTLYGNSMPLAFGSVSAAGEINLDYGITQVNQIVLGTYDITVNTPFNTEFPVAIITPVLGIFDAPRLSAYQRTNSTTIRVSLKTIDGMLSDTPFSIVIFDGQ